MALRITIYDRARLEFRDAFTWYELQSEGLGARFDMAVSIRLHSLAQNPRQGKVIRNELRETRVSRAFPYLIVYQLSDDESELFILSFFHTSRNPRLK